MGLDERRVVHTAVLLAQGNDLYNLGSGYLIADGLVLTAAHVLERTDGAAAREGESVEVARLGGDWQPARVAWVDAGRDVAVVRCSGLRAGGGIRWGRLVGSDPLKGMRWVFRVLRWNTKVDVSLSMPMARRRLSATGQPGVWR